MRPCLGSHRRRRLRRRGSAARTVLLIAAHWTASVPSQRIATGAFDANGAQRRSACMCVRVRLGAHGRLQGLAGGHVVRACMQERPFHTHQCAQAATRAEWRGVVRALSASASLGRTNPAQVDEPTPLPPRRTFSLAQQQQQ